MQKQPTSIIRRQNIATAVTDAIRERILNGDYPKGSLLRQEVLAETFGVSRMPIREALRNLEAEGLIIMQVSRSALVTDCSIDEIDEVFRLRTVLEVELLRYAMPRMTSASLARSEALAEQLTQSYENNDIKQWGALNTEFHLSLYQPAGKDLWLGMIQKLNNQVDRYIRLQLVLDHDIRQASEEHQELCRLCRAGDIEAAVRLLTHHIDATRDKLLRNLREKQGQAASS